MSDSSSGAVQLPEDAQRVLIYGVTGSGKSSFANTLGLLTGIPVHLVDEEFGWLPDWTKRAEEEMVRMAESALAEPAWIFDSAYQEYRSQATDRAQLVICLDYSRTRTLWRLVRRTLRRVRTAESICNGNRETWRKVLSMDSIIIWHFRSFTAKRRQMRTLATTPGTLCFRNPRQCQRWLDSLVPVAPTPFSPGSASPGRTSL
ncbi:adenylate kinase [Psychromicrobium xiongbiense]|uniref:adenylate kinase n=1 Tax=Psychromicrobium xiongbiense TaxID=3051184 RepID=UPI0025542A50|nr:adenylate kinase [Psychromicrobium sp. YIM S02556]